MSKLKQFGITLMVAALLVLAVGLYTSKESTVDAQVTLLDYTLMGRDAGGRELNVWVDDSRNIICYIITRVEPGATADISCVKGK